MRILISVALSLIIAHVAEAAQTRTFYVSPDGDDFAAGTLEAPWATLSATSHKLPVNGSWTLLLRRNSTWLNDALSITLGPSQGSIAIDAYGNQTLTRPQINLPRGMSDGGVACIAVSGIGAEPSSSSLSSLTIRNVHFSGCSQGIQLRPAASRIATQITISDNAFLDIRTPFLRYTPPNPQWATSILLLQGNYSNLSVRHNIAARIDTFFGSMGYIEGMHLDGNTVQQCSGNCYNFGAGVGLLMENSVMLRDVSDRLFLYGTTDVIVGGLEGDNAVVNNDFNQRGEYQGGPDGCAFDFETGTSGFVVRGNTFYRSWGAGIMIFGHATTSHNFQITDNVFAHAGCVQNRDDRGGIAVMCPNGQKPSGNVSFNTFYTCPGVPAFFVNPNVPGCADGLNQQGNVINGAQPMVEMPQLSFEPPSPQSTVLSGLFFAIGVTTTPNATIRYTIDGSRPTENSPVLPFWGIPLFWPSSAIAVNLRAFKEGMIPSITNGAVVELNYVMSRSAPNAFRLGPNGMLVGDLLGHFDEVIVSGNGSSAIAGGWAMDTNLPKGGWGPVVVAVSVDGEPVVAGLAIGDRPDLVKAGVAPNPQHGFAFDLPSAAVQRMLSPGRHVVEAKALGSPSAPMPRGLPWKSIFAFCDGVPC